MSITVLWQSDSAIAINKPCGLATQAPPGLPSVESSLLQQLDREGRYLAFPHRLDRDTSGVLLAAFTKRAANLISGQFASRKTVKRYVAVVEGHVSLDHNEDAVWTDWIRKVDGEARGEVCLPDPEGNMPQGAKKAVTNVESVEHVTNSQHFSQSRNLTGFQFLPDSATTRIVLRPETGRMHQLRIQCAQRGHPIVGDAKYGSNVEPKLTDVMQVNGSMAGEANRRILLHAWKLAFHDPTNGRKIELTAESFF